MSIEPTLQDLVAEGLSTYRTTDLFEELRDLIGLSDHHSIQRAIAITNEIEYRIDNPTRLSSVAMELAFKSVS